MWSKLESAKPPHEPASEVQTNTKDKSSDKRRATNRNPCCTATGASAAAVVAGA